MIRTKKKPSAVDDVQAALRAHEAELEQARERAREVERVATRQEGLEAELARLTARRDKALALGDAHAELTYQVEFKGFGLLDAQPVRSAMTGNELAAWLQPKIDDVEGQLRDIHEAVAALDA